MTHELEDFYNARPEHKGEVFQKLTVHGKLYVVYNEITAFRDDVRKMEEQAKEMASPDALLKMAEKMMGGNLL